MKIAVFGDIHGNIGALEAAYDEALSAQVDRMYHLGDLGGYAPFVNEVVDFIIAHRIEGVQGNYDYNVAHESMHCGCRYEDPVQAEIAEASFAWTKSHTTQRSKDFMKRLPPSLSFASGRTKVMLFHATPHKNNLYWFETRPEKFFFEMAEKAKADLLVYGHTHIPYRKNFMGKVFINAGSVGKPKDGDPRACLTFLDITDQGIWHQVIRVSYDLEKTASAILLSGLPTALADRLKQGR